MCDDELEKYPELDWSEEDELRQQENSKYVKVKCPCNSLCFKCDPTGIERFYHQYEPYKDCIDPKDIWYEFCALREEREIDDKIDEKDVPEDIYNLKDSWT